MFRPGNKKAAREELGLSPARRYLLCVGRHVLKKGFDVAIQSLHKYRILDPSCELIILGTGPETQNLKSLADELGVSSHVHFPGSVLYEQVPIFMTACDIVLCPSRSVYDPRRFAIDYETMCRVACEALACGRLVIASRVGGIPSVVAHKETGILLKENDPEALADQIAATFENPRETIGIEKNASNWASSALSFDTVNESVMGLLLESHE